ncbi:hypothetical protein KM043_011062 [Ampulex compressa]|nr:hypothetical protein KM043_011062 [Ampulex compressa]
MEHSRADKLLSEGTTLLARRNIFHLLEERRRFAKKVKEVLNVWQDAEKANHFVSRRDILYPRECNLCRTSTTPSCSSRGNTPRFIEVLESGEHRGKTKYLRENHRDRQKAWKRKKSATLEYEVETQGAKRCFPLEAMKIGKRRRALRKWDGGKRGKAKEGRWQGERRQLRTSHPSLYRQGVVEDRDPSWNGPAQMGDSRKKRRAATEASAQQGPPSAGCHWHVFRFYPLG